MRLPASPATYCGKNFFAVLSVITREYNCENAVLAFPALNGNVNMLNSDGSAYFPDAYTDLSPMANSNFVWPSDVRHVFAMPGISLCIAEPITPAVDQCVNTPASNRAFTRAKY